MIFFIIFTPITLRRQNFYSIMKLIKSKNRKNTKNSQLCQLWNPISQPTDFYQKSGLQKSTRNIVEFHIYSSTGRLMTPLRVTIITIFIRSILIGGEWWHFCSYRPRQSKLDSHIYCEFKTVFRLKIGWNFANCPSIFENSFPLKFFFRKISELS